MNKRAQLTIFIIIAIIITAGIITVFFILPSGPKGDASEVSNQILDKCVGDALEEAIGKILANGGFSEPHDSVRYFDEEYSYLCYQENSFQACVNQYPDLIDVIEDEIKSDIEGDVAKCIIKLEEEFRNQGWDVTGSGSGLEIKVMPENVLANIDRIIKIQKGGEAQEFSGFGVQKNSDLGNLALIAIDIINQEAEFCDFDYNLFMIINPDYDIKSITYQDSEIYKIKDRQSLDEFRFAIKGCVIL